MPDPGLTDLIAAHTLRVVELNEAVRYPECNGCDWVGGLVKDHAVHLASVVEQHTNGQIAELDWDALVAAIPDGWELRESAQLEEVSRVRQRDLEASQATTARWRSRAETVEATIARVRAVEAEYLDPEDADIECREDVWRFIRDLRAALEGVGDADPT